MRTSAFWKCVTCGRLTQEVSPAKKETCRACGGCGWRLVWEPPLASDDREPDTVLALVAFIVLATLTLMVVARVLGQGDQ